MCMMFLFLQLAVRSETPGIEFTTVSGRHYKSRKVNKAAGNQKWEIVEDSTLRKVADTQVGFRVRSSLFWWHERLD